MDEDALKLTPREAWILNELQEQQEEFEMPDETSLEDVMKALKKLATIAEAFDAPR